MFGRKKDQTYRFVIGPHWYISIIGFTLICLVGGLVIFPLWNSLTLVLRILYLTIFSFALLMYLIMFFKNPGVVPQKRNAPAVTDVENKSEYSCPKCLTVREQRAYHCEDCDVCIEGFDHHCIWVGKCVGAKNLIAFYVFVASIPIFFMFIMLMSCFLSIEVTKHVRP